MLKHSTLYQEELTVHPTKKILDLKKMLNSAKKPFLLNEAVLHEGRKKQYISPVLSELGSMVKVTQGGSKLIPDSGQGPGTGLSDV